MHLRTKLMIFIDIIIVICFFVVYGPIDKARVFWITTAMETGSHKYFAYIFYSEDKVKQIMSENYLEEINEETNSESIAIGKQEASSAYASVYEKEILEHGEEDLYKLIEFKYKEFNCYLIAVYDPTRVEAVYNKKLSSGRILTEISKDNKAIAAINGGGYSWKNGYPQGLVVHNGKVVSSRSTWKATGAITYDGVLLVGKLKAADVKKKNIKEALTFGPVLIVNGKAANIKGTGGSGMNPRTVIAQRKDGIILFLVVNGYGRKLSYKGRGGVYYSDLIKILQRYNAYNAINMDGGSSTTMVINNKLINEPCEPLKNGQDFIRSAWILR